MLLEELIQVSKLHVLHYDAQRVVLAADTQHTHHVRIFQATHDLHFSVEIKSAKGEKKTIHKSIKCCNVRCQAPQRQGVPFTWHFRPHSSWVFWRQPSWKRFYPEFQCRPSFCWPENRLQSSRSCWRLHKGAPAKGQGFWNVSRVLLRVSTTQAEPFIVQDRRSRV